MCVCVCVFVCMCVVCVCNNTMSVWVKFASILDLATTARNSSTPTRQPQCMGIKSLYDTQQVKISTCVCVCMCVCVKSQSQCGFNLQAYWIWHTQTTARNSLTRHCLTQSTHRSTSIYGHQMIPNKSK